MSSKYVSIQNISSVSQYKERAQKKYQELQGQAKRDALTNCLVAQDVNNQDKRPKVKLPNTREEHKGEKLQMYVHHLVFIANLNEDPTHLTQQDYEVSHLCHNVNCINAEHLRWESKDLNADRNRCHGQSWVTCPCCSHTFNPCKHNPQCILPGKPQESALSSKEELAYDDDDDFVEEVKKKPKKMNKWSINI